MIPILGFFKRVRFVGFLREFDPWLSFFFFSNTARAKNPKQREKEATGRKEKENMREREKVCLIN
jgi:hypothetical protein